MASENASAKTTKPRVPQQERGRARVEALKKAGETIFVEKGFDAATMTEIAARARAAIGTLYLFFPTKNALALAILADCAEELSGRLDALADRAAGLPAARIADALFDVLSEFLAAFPAYSALLDVPGDEQWRRSVRARRRTQIAALFRNSEPPLEGRRAERLAVLVPQLMRIPLGFTGDRSLREGVTEDLRRMLVRDLTSTEAD